MEMIEDEKSHVIRFKDPFPWEKVKKKKGYFSIQKSQ